MLKGIDNSLSAITNASAESRIPCHNNATLFGCGVVEFSFPGILKILRT